MAGTHDVPSSSQACQLAFVIWRHELTNTSTRCIVEKLMGSFEGNVDRLNRPLTTWMGGLAKVDFFFSSEAGRSGNRN
jgi:hypothetical protein